jgi:hypothetical protein
LPSVQQVLGFLFFSDKVFRDSVAKSQYHNAVACGSTVM